MYLKLPAKWKISCVPKFCVISLLFLHSFNYHAQNGPGGLEDISGTSDLKLWLDADQIEGVYSLNNLTEWLDHSGYDHHASTVNSASKPNYIESAVNGFPALRFDGFSEFMEGTITGGVSAPSTLIAVAYYEDLHQSSGINSYVISVGSGGGSRQHTSIGRRRPNSGNGDRYYSWDNQDARIGDSIKGQSWNIIAQLNQSSVPYHRAFINNQESIAVDDYLGPISTNSIYTLGKWYFGSNTWLDGYIAEVILFSKALSELELNILNSYLAAKYDITIESDMYSGDDIGLGNNDRNVAGIGVEVDSNIIAKSKGLNINMEDGFEDGDYLLFGHAEEQNDLEEIDVSGSIEERWKRAWYLDITNTNDNQIVHLTFDLIEGEVGYGAFNSSNKSDYKLIYRNSTSGSWTVVSDASVVTRNRVTFNNIELTNDGFYTLGTVNKSNSPLGNGLLSSGSDGPGGVGTTDGSSNLKIWYKTPDIEGDDGDEVVFLKDASGNENHVEQTTVLNIPSLDAEAVNGLNAVTFNGINSYLGGTIQGGGLSAPLSVFTVGYFNNTDQADDDNDYIYSIGKGLSRSDQLSVSRRKANDEDDLDNINKYYSWDGDTARYGNKLNGQEWYLFNQKYYVDANSVQFSTDINGTEVSVNDYEESVSTSDEISIGRWNSNEHWLDGSFAEFILFDRVLNSAEESIITEYLGAKYDISISSQFYIGDSSRYAHHDRDVIGVGTEADGSNINASAAGLKLEQVSGFENGDYLIAGHAEVVKGVSYTDAVDNTGENIGRWSRAWYFDITDASDNMRVNIVFDFGDAASGEFPGSLDNVNYNLLYRADTSGNWTSIITPATVEGDQVQFNDVGFLSDGFYTLGSSNTTASPLPVTLVNFDLKLSETGVYLQWRTVSEINNDHFVIERKVDHDGYKPIAIIKGKGNSSESINYTHLDKSLESTVNLVYYRLKQVDFDGKFSYYGPKVIRLENRNKIKVEPNPVNSKLKVVGLTGGEEVVLIDTRGNLKWKGTYRPESNLIIEVESYPKGLYFMRVNDQFNTTVIKVIVL